MKVTFFHPDDFYRELQDNRASTDGVVRLSTRVQPRCDLLTAEVIAQALVGNWVYTLEHFVAAEPPNRTDGLLAARLENARRAVEEALCGRGFDVRPGVLEP